MRHGGMECGRVFRRPDRRGSGSGHRTLGPRRKQIICAPEKGLPCAPVQAQPTVRSRKQNNHFRLHMARESPFFIFRDTFERAKAPGGSPPRLGPTCRREIGASGRTRQGESDFGIEDGQGGAGRDSRFRARGRWRPGDGDRHNGLCGFRVLRQGAKARPCRRTSHDFGLMCWRAGNGRLRFLGRDESVRGEAGFRSGFPGWRAQKRGHARAMPGPGGRACPDRPGRFPRRG